MDESPDPADEGEEFDFVLEALLHQITTLRRARARVEQNGSRTNAIMLMRQVLMFSRVLLGQKAYDLAMGRVDQADGNGLRLIANRLQAISPFMQGEWPDGLTYNDFVEEVYAIAGGDAPYILSQAEKRRGKQGNSFRLATHKLNALMWAQVLHRRGVEANRRQSILSSAFGSTWEAIRKWKAECIEKLGLDEYDRAIGQSEFADLDFENGVMSDQEVEDAIYAAGQRFHAERVR